MSTAGVVDVGVVIPAALLRDPDVAVITERDNLPVMTFAILLNLVHVIDARPQNPRLMIVTVLRDAARAAALIHVDD